MYVLHIIYNNIIIGSFIGRYTESFNSNFNDVMLMHSEVLNCMKVWAAKLNLQYFY